MTPVPTVDAFLEPFPEEIRATSHRLRALVREAVPDVLEAVYPGWGLIGYRVPYGRKTRYLGFVCPYPDHVRLGFEQGRLLSDPAGLLRGEGLRQVRYVEVYRPGDVRDEDVRALVVQAAVRLLRDGQAPPRR